MKHILIIANGIPLDADLLKNRIGQLDLTLVVAADGGSHLAYQLGLKVDAVVGDHDSFVELPDEIRQSIEEQTSTFMKHSPEKDETDLELALLYAVEQSSDPIVVIGAIGGRVDMTLSNLLLLTHPQLENRHVELWEGQQTIQLLRPPGDEVRGSEGDTLSLVPIGGIAEGIKTEGLQYPLKDETLYTGPARGVSNVMLGDKALVNFTSGFLLAIHTPGRA